MLLLQFFGGYSVLVSWHSASTGGWFVKKRRGLELKAASVCLLGNLSLYSFSMTPRFGFTVLAGQDCSFTTHTYMHHTHSRVLTYPYA